MSQEKDKKLEQIFNAFDKADKVFMKDYDISLYQELYDNIEKRTKAGEFTNDQGIAILDRSTKSQELFLKAKKEKLHEIMQRTENTKNMKKYIKNSHLPKNTKK